MPTSRTGISYACALVLGASSSAWANNPVPADETAARTQRIKAAFPGVRIEASDGRISAFYGVPMTSAATPAAAVDAWWGSYGDAFGIDGLELELVDTCESITDKFTFVAYRQLMDELPVELGIARVLVLNGDPFRVVRVAGVLAQRPTNGFAPDTVTAEEAVASVAGLQGSQLPAATGWLHDHGGKTEIADFTVGDRLTRWSQPDLVVFAGDPVSTDVPFGSITAVRAWRFVGEHPDLADFDSFSFFVDAATGRLVYVRNEKYHIDVSGTVTGKGSPGMLPDIASNPAVPMNMPEIRVNITGGSNAFGDRNGAYTVPNGGTTPVTVTTNVSGGRWVDVNTNAGTEMALSQSVTPPGPGNFEFNSAPSQFNTAQVNGFIHTNNIHNFITDRTTWTGLTNTPIPCIVNIASSCNAFYSGFTINFYQMLGNCNNTAYTGVVAHEYGHNIVARRGLGQGGFGEGFGDCCALLLYDDPILGRFFTLSGGFVRTYDVGQAPDPFPCAASCGGESHCCGESLAGTWYDIRRQFGTRYGSGPGLTLVQQFFVDWAMVTIGGQGANSITMTTLNEILTIDDDDGNLANGTPNYPQICAATGPHMLPCPPISLLDFTFPDGIPTTLVPNSPTSFRVNVTGISATPTAGSGTMSYRVGNVGPYTTIPMTQGAPNQYTATLPAVSCGSRVSFYVTSGSSSGNVNYPSGAPTSVLSASANLGTTTIFVDEMEGASTNWTVGAAGDNATTGVWVRVDPVGTAAQPEDDHTTAPGVTCWVTGQGTVGGAIGANDVDGGHTTLVSPVLNLAGQDTAAVGYWRWFSNAESASNPNDDVFTVQVSNNGTTWVTAEVVGPSGPETEPGWFFHSFVVADFVAPTATVRVRFIAADEGVGGSIVEAAVDDFRVTVANCAPPACPGNLDGNNVVDVNDLAILLAHFGTASGANPADGDIDNDDDVDLSDLALLLAAFGNACP